MRNQNLIVVLFLSLSFLLIACNNTNNPVHTSEKNVSSITNDDISISKTQAPNTFVDTRDNKIYKTIKIGTQTWMAENLAFKPQTGKYWAYNFDTANIIKYGYYYDIETLNSIAPSGWHIPTKLELKTLIKYLKEKYKDPVKAVLENGESGFNVKLIGYLDDDRKMFVGFGEWTHFWSSANNASARHYLTISDDERLKDIYYNGDVGGNVFTLSLIHI